MFPSEPKSIADQCHASTSSELDFNKCLAESEKAAKAKNSESKKPTPEAQRIKKASGRKRYQNAPSPQE